MTKTIRKNTKPKTRPRKISAEMDVFDIPNQLEPKAGEKVPFMLLTSVMTALVLLQVGSIGYLQILISEAGNDTSGLEMVAAFVLFQL